MDTVKKNSIPRVSLTGLLILASLSGAGCTTLGKSVGAPIPAEQAAMAEGITSVRRIIELFGPPTHMSALPGGFVMVTQKQR